VLVEVIESVLFISIKLLFDVFGAALAMGDRFGGRSAG
jgi:hypothetical protein